MFERRRERLCERLQEKKVDVVLINDPSNLYYYTGFTGGDAFFMMSLPEKKGYIITDSRYYEQVEMECPDLILVKWEKKGLTEVIKDVIQEVESVSRRTNRFSDDANASKEDVRPDESKLQIAIENRLNLEQYLKLCKQLEYCELRICSDAIDSGRMVKDETELKKLQKAETIGDEAFTHILDVLKPGITEAEIALELEYYMKKQGASKLSFDSIIASGPNSSMPHAQVTDRKLRQGDFVTMDFGCIYQGYCSDMTRTVAIGEPSDEMRKVYQIVLDANQRAMEQIAEGKKCSDIDALARDYIREQGYGEYFGHGLGHGVGLDIHEEPRFSPKCDVITEENMVITVEPGIYLPGRFGVRIEDLVVVKKNGYEKLSKSNKELIII